MIYLDHAASTPMSEKALAAYAAAAGRFYANTKSLHEEGQLAEEMLDILRKELAVLHNVPAQGLYFTSGGTEGNFLAITSLARFDSGGSGRHLITTEIEHPSVLNTFSMLEKDGFSVTRLKPDKYGRISPAALQAALRPETKLVSIQHVNSEIGTIQPISELGSVLKGTGALFHSDCVQSFGKVDFDPLSAGLDSFTTSAHKINGPKGTGAVYINPAIGFDPFYPNSAHENGFRPGTVDLPAVAAFTAAASETVSTQEIRLNKNRKLRKKFLSGIMDGNRKIMIEGHPQETAPHIIGLRVEGMEGQMLMQACSRNGIAFATGSACSSSKQQPSHVLTAIGRTADEARSFCRISLGSMTTGDEIDKTVDVFKHAIKEMLPVPRR